MVRRQTVLGQIRARLMERMMMGDGAITIGVTDPLTIGAVTTGAMIVPMIVPMIGAVIIGVKIAQMIGAPIIGAKIKRLAPKKTRKKIT